MSEQAHQIQLLKTIIRLQGRRHAELIGNKKIWKNFDESELDLVIQEYQETYGSLQPSTHVKTTD